MPSASSQRAEADSYLQNAQKRIEEQKLVVEKMMAEGQDTRSAKRLLAIYHDLLAALTPKR